jgi:hypothetical protein
VKVVSIVCVILFFVLFCYQQSVLEKGCGGCPFLTRWSQAVGALYCCKQTVDFHR